MAVLDEVKNIICSTLQIEERIESVTKETQLLGSIPEFDSMAVVAVMTSIEEYYGVAIDDDEVDAETFETIGSLVSFVENKIN